MDSRCTPTWAARPNPNPSPNPNPNPHPNQPLCADVGGAVEGVIEMDTILQKDFKEPNPHPNPNSNPEGLQGA